MNPKEYTVADFINALTGGHHDADFNFRLFIDSGRGGGAINLIGTYLEHEDLLLKKNSEGFGVYLVVNDFDVEEGRKRVDEGGGVADVNIGSTRAVFADLDGVPLEVIEQYSLKPHIVVESSPGRWHVYWLVDSEFPVNCFRGVQTKFADMFGSDPSIKNESRVMRLPGFFHMKDSKKPFKSRIIEINPHPPYSFMETNDALGGEITLVKDIVEDVVEPYLPESTAPDLQSQDLDEVLLAGIIRNFMEEGVIPEGKRNNTLVSIVGRLINNSLNEAERVKYLRHINEAHCQPPLDDKEVMGIIKSSQKMNVNPGTPMRTDIGLAERFVRLSKGDFRYCYPWKSWMNYDGVRWRLDNSGAVMRMAKKVPRVIYEEASRAFWVGEKTLAKEISSFATASQNVTRLKAMVDLARSELAISPDDLDSNPNLFNVKNGTIDLKKGEFREHRREDFITKLAPVVYNLEAKCPLFDQFIFRVMAENANLIKFLQKISGYELTGSVLEQCFFILYGTGANGKSTYLEVKQELFGNYARPTEFRTLLDKGKNSDAVRNDLAALKGLRLVTSVEVGKEQRIDESLIKQLTGGDTITARFLFKEFFDFRPEFKLELAANNKPQIRGVDHGIWRRVRLIPFEVTIPEEEQDRNLLQKLKEELPGILNWCLRGHQMWLGEGLESPPEVEEATESYRAESDFLANFIQECCWSEADEPPLGTELKVSAQELYRTYEAWCLGPGASDSVKKVKFGKMMKERGYIAQNVWFDGKQQQTYINIGLRDSARDMVSEVMGSNPSLLFP